MKTVRKKTKSYKTEALGFGFLIFFVFTISCKKESLSAKQIMENTIGVYGGIEAWNSIKQLDFDKKVVLFLEDGSVQRQTDQFQLFQFQKPFGKIEWQEDTIEHQIIYENETISKLENDSLLIDSDEINRAKRAFFASEYVIKQPFDLLRDDVLLTKHNDTIFNKKACYIIAVAYKHEALDADRWHYIIDKETFKITANKIVLKDHTSWVENLTFDTSAGFIFNAHRKSYRLNNKGEKTYLRAEYWYSNFSVLSQE